MKKTIAFLLSLCLVGGASPAFTSFAPKTSITASAMADSGKCGENITWTFDKSTGTLTVSGTGDMKNYDWAESPFYNNTTIKAVVIERGVTSIGESVFENCFSLISVSIPNSVTRICSDAFSACTSLEAVTIPNSVTRIDNYAFYNTNLEEIIIPASVALIDNLAFSFCKNLKSVTIMDPDCDIYDSRSTICNGYDEKEVSHYFNGTICGYENSTAQKYADKYGYGFEALPEPLPGDVDLNEIVDGRDASTVLTHYALTSTGKAGVITDASALINADWDENGIIDGRDASAILTYYAQQSVSENS